MGASEIGESAQVVTILTLFHLQGRISDRIQGRTRKAVLEVVTLKSTGKFKGLSQTWGRANLRVSIPVDRFRMHQG